MQVKARIAAEISRRVFEELPLPNSTITGSDAHPWTIASAWSRRIASSVRVG